MFYKHKKIFITGGAGFIGPHLLDKLIKQDSETAVGDNLSIGYITSVLKVWKQNNLKYKKTSWGYQAENNHKFFLVDFQNLEDTLKAFQGFEIVFHLAATHGGRGFIDTHPADCSENFAINQNIVKAAHLANVDRIQFASSACVYPVDMQNNYQSSYLLKEEDAFKDNWGNADQEYGWSKLMGELILQAYYKQYRLKSSITRYVTAYGPGENDTHAIIALIKRAVEKQDPYLIWGSGKQDRDFTYVDDIVSGTLAACEKITNADSLNLGTGQRYTIAEVANIIFEIIGWHPNKIVFDKTKPEGVKTRALNIAKAKKRLNWQPIFTLKQGLVRTIDWYVKTKPKSVEKIL